jgi:hypothetical protein
VALALPSIALSPLCWHDGGGSNGKNRNKISTPAQFTGLGARFVCFVFFFLLKSLNPCAVEAKSGKNPRPFLDLEFVCGILLISLPNLPAKPLFSSTVHGFSCADLNPEL